MLAAVEVGMGRGEREESRKVGSLGPITIPIPSTTTTDSHDVH